MVPPHPAAGRQGRAAGCGGRHGQARRLRRLRWRGDELGQDRVGKPHGLCKEEPRCLRHDPLGGSGAKGCGPEHGQVQRGHACKGGTGSARRYVGGRGFQGCELLVEHQGREGGRLHGGGHEAAAAGLRHAPLRPPRRGRALPAPGRQRLARRQPPEPGRGGGRRAAAEEGALPWRELRGRQSWPAFPSLMEALLGDCARAGSREAAGRPAAPPAGLPGRGGPAGAVCHARRRQEHRGGHEVPGIPHWQP
mmetsp:Transcript_98766/g.299758  ORF Transcript_98766/g.299758 Transcript_98766/m.299758 type:complete len:250 (-) Transcript_98766:686-1435(-)